MKQSNSTAADIKWFEQNELEADTYVRQDLGQKWIPDSVAAAKALPVQDEGLVLNPHSLDHKHPRNSYPWVLQVCECTKYVL